MAAFRARPFPRKVISALKEHGSDGKLTFRQARAMRALLRRDETWHLLVDARQHSDEQLAELVSTDVFREPAISSRSRLVAAWVRAATSGALGSEARANFVISNVRDVGDDVAAGNRKLSQVGDQVNEIHSMVSSKAVFVDPEVLVQGPLVALGLDPDRKHAAELAESDPAAASALLEGIVERLTTDGLEPLARDLKVERASLLGAAGQTARAAEAWTNLALDTIDRGISAHDTSAANSLTTLASNADAPDWLIHRAAAITAAYAWHLDPNADGSEVMREAANAAGASDPRAALLFRIAAEACLASNNLDDIATHLELIRGVASSDQSEDGIRLRLAVADVTQDEDDWSALDELAQPGTGTVLAPLAALIFARHARSLLFNGSPLLAADYFSRAVERGCRGALWQDAAEWTLGRVRSLGRAGAVGEEMNRLALQVPTLRAAGNNSLIRRAYDAHASAMEKILADKLSSALPLLKRHLRDSIWAGHVEAEISGHRLMGDLYDKTGREPSLAIRHMIAGADGKRATKVAQSADIYVDLLQEARGADETVQEGAFRVAAAMADVIPDQAVSDWAEASLVAVENRTGGFFAPQPWIYAFKVTAELSRRGLTDDQFERIIQSVDTLLPREPGQYTHADDAIVDLLANSAVAMPARQQTITDRIVTIIRLSDQMATRLESKGAALYALTELMTAPLIELAEQGNGHALNILALRGDSIPMLEEAAVSEIESSIGRSNAYSLNGVNMLADAAGAVKFAFAAPSSLQEALARDFARRAIDANDMESNRAQSASGVGAMAQYLEREVRQELFAAMETIASSDAPLSPFDETNRMFSHPLGNIQLSFGEGELRRAAVSAMTELSSDDAMAASTWDLIIPLMRSDDVSDHLTGARAIYSLSSRGLSVPYSWQLLATAADPRLRQAAAALLGTLEVFQDDLVVQLAGDPHVSVRREISAAFDNIATHSGHLASELRVILDADPHFSVRDHAT